MPRTMTVIFDGEVLRPEVPLDLRRNQRLHITIEEDGEPPVDEQAGPFDRILALAEDLGVTDLAEQHDHYLYGTPKR